MKFLKMVGRGAGCNFVGQFSYRSSHPEVFLGKGVLKIYSKATLLISHFGMGVILILLHIFRTAFPKNTSGWLLLLILIKVIVKFFPNEENDLPMQLSIEESTLTFTKCEPRHALNLLWFLILRLMLVVT